MLNQNLSIGIERELSSSWHSLQLPSLALHTETLQRTLADEALFSTHWFSDLGDRMRETVGRLSEGSFFGGRPSPKRTGKDHQEGPAQGTDFFQVKEFLAGYAHHEVWVQRDINRPTWSRAQVALNSTSGVVKVDLSFQNAEVLTLTNQMLLNNEIHVAPFSPEQIAAAQPKAWDYLLDFKLKGRLAEYAEQRQKAKEALGRWLYAVQKTRDCVQRILHLKK